MRHLLAVAALVAAFVFLAPVVWAHSWYSQKRDPIFGKMTSCCGGSDCAPLDVRFIDFSDPRGIRVTLTPEQAQAINYNRRTGFDEFIDYARLQPSEDNLWHICLMGDTVSSDPRRGYYCIFEPRGM
ncbi:MAG: hypothetical protein RJA36_313 [Pseudomonadota bacterium]|jgi:hypothetical protein